MRARSRSSSVAAVGLAWAVVACGWASPARAQVGERTALDRAIAHAEDADFASALASFEEAEAAGDLSRDDLVRLFSQRATVHFALGQVPAMEADLARLLALAPDAQLPASVPPPVREAVDRMRGSIAAPQLTAEARPRSGDATSGVEVRAQVRERGADLVRGLRAYARRAPEGAWERGDGGAITIEAPPLSSVEWYAEALGPGGVIVASEGSAARPHRIVVPEPPPIASGSSDEAMWWAIGGGGAAVVIGAIVTGIALAATSITNTTIGGPTLVP